MMEFKVYLFVEFLALITGIIYWGETRKTKLHYLPLFLLLICLVELINLYLSGNNMRDAAKLVYTFSLPIEFSFYLFFIYLHGERVSRKVIFILFLLFNLLNIVGQFIQSAYKGPYFTVILGDICVTLAVCFYLIDLFRKETEESLFSNYFFWIASGLLLFCLGEMGYNFLNPYIKANNLDEYGKLFKLINNNLLVVLYGSYITAFILHHRQLKKNAT
ncbi:MAG TPA: hypothetical protein PKC62_09010 [Ferruginibacter sp.]|nr:hypothetical protein [Bacteroidota bacterium]MBS1926819.1 hypothetical protein [Bacteroidota bacterium]MCC6692250.1 hypothetical protein [Chitinophagaceae bacterium]HMT96812.1 hypothetical protein [Ferruginibacter sp.]